MGANEVGDCLLCNFDFHIKLVSFTNIDIYPIYGPSSSYKWPLASKCAKFRNAMLKYYIIFRHKFLFFRYNHVKIQFIESFVYPSHFLQQGLYSI